MTFTDAGYMLSNVESGIAVHIDEIVETQGRSASCFGLKARASKYKKFGVL